MVPAPPFRVLLLLAPPQSVPPSLQPEAASAWGPFEVQCIDAAQASEQDGALGEAAAVVVAAEVLATLPAPERWLREWAARTAVLVAAPVDDAATIAPWLRRGVQDVLASGELQQPALARRLRLAIERKAAERESHKAYATDLDTGLPHRQQLVEHMSHLLALREREPAPMALLALRIEGFSSTEARLGREASNVLRRKVAVRLRAGVRASDVVASLGDDTFGVLLARMLASADAQRVGEKLLRALRQPFKVAGQEVAVAAALGVAQHPQDGTQPEALLARAVGLAGSATANGRAGLSNFVEAGGRAPSAANDES